MQPQLDETTIGRLERRIGIPVRSRQRPHNEVPSEESIRHFALGYGDDNPLWCSRQQAESSVWKGIIAPPMYPISAAHPRPVTWSPDQQEAMAGGDPLAGMGQYMCGERWVFARPVRAGDRMTKTQCLDAAVLKRSAFGGGVGALVSHRTEFASAGDVEAICVRYVDFWHAERSASASSGKYRDLQRHIYDAAEIAALDALYDQESVQGATARPWESVRVGDVLGPIAKGPLTLTDIITYHVAIGWGGYGGGTAKVAYKNRQRIPKFYTLNQYGIPDSAQRCHWDEDWARQLGHPTAYDYGAIRTNWMIHLVTNWMGDAGWLWKLSASIRKFNYLGDAHTIRGVVTACRAGRESGEVDISVEGTNQDGVMTCCSAVTVLLPREHSTMVEVPRLDDTVAPSAVAPGGP